MRNTTLNDVQLFEFKTVVEPDGSLVPIENFPFEIKRMFYVFDVHDQNNRGKHAHFTTQQLLICMHGRLEVTCSDGTNRKTYILNHSSQAIYVPEMIWDEQKYMLPNTIMLSLANTKYDIDDYINDYDEFKGLKESKGSNMKIEKLKEIIIEHFERELCLMEYLIPFEKDDIGRFTFISHRLDEEKLKDPDYMLSYSIKEEDLIWKEIVVELELAGYITKYKHEDAWVYYKTPIGEVDLTK